MTELQPSSGSFGGLLRTQAGSDDTGERPRSRKTSERVASDIVHDIVEQSLHPGDRLPLEAAMIKDGIDPIAFTGVTLAAVLLAFLGSRLFERRDV